MVFNVKKSINFFIAFVLFSSIGKSQVQLVINEVTQGYSGSQEYVELLVVGTPTCNAIPTYDIRNYYIDDNNGTFANGAGTGIADGCVRLTNDPLWSNVPAGTLILIYNDGANLNPDINPANDDFSTSDGNCKLQIPISNCTYLDHHTTQPNVGNATYPGALAACGNWTNIAMANAHDSFHTLDASGNLIHAVSWGNNNANGNQIIYFAPDQTGLVCAMQNSTNNNIALQANWTSVAVSAVTQTPGMPNNAANAAWINSMNNSCSALTALSTPITFANAGCGCTGSATVTASGAIGPYTYSWTPSGGTSATASNLCAGNYTVTVTSSNGCVNTPTVTISATSTLSSTITANNISCNGGNNGTSNVTVSGGSGSYTYTWSPSGGNGSSASGLSAGTYTVNFSDGGCTGSKTVTVTQPPSALTASANAVTNVNCYGGSTGSATVAASGGTAGYSYTWSPSGGTGTTASGLAAGNYTVITTDSHSCTTTNVVAITQPAAALTATTNVTNVNCNGSSTGSSTVNVSGGTSAYTYSWSPSGGTSATASGLSVGNYTVTTTDAHNCITTNTIAISQPSAITLTVSSTQATCGSSNGTTSVSATGGTGSYTYSWTPSGGTSASASGLASGNYTVIVTDVNGCIKTGNTTVTNAGGPSGSVTSTSVTCNGSSTGTATVTPSGTGPFTFTWSPSGGTGTVASGLSAGNYTVAISDVNNCVATATVSVTQPAPLAATTTVTNVNCNGASTGSSTVNVLGGTSGYTYSWSPSGGTSATASGLSVGNYSVTITDAHNCITINTIAISQPSAITLTVSSTQATCGSSNGTTSVSATGGTGSYTYSWTPSGGTGTTASGLGSGNYTVTVTDVNGCVKTGNTTVTNAGGPSGSVTSTSLTCNGNNNGTATVTPSGSGPFTFTWSPSGGNNATASGFSAGNYTVAISDVNNCVSTATVSVTQPAPLAATTTVTNVNCNGASTGSSTVNVSGGTSAYTYSWSPSGGTSATASGLSVGNYTVTITDVHSCSITNTVSVSQPAVITLTTTSSPANCGASNGTASVTASGGTGSYTYSWSPSGGTNPVASGLGTGNYTVAVTDVNGCIKTGNISITNIGGPTGSVTSTSITCNGNNSGTATVTPSGTGPFTFTWSPSGGNNANASGLSAGNYTVTIADANNCVGTNTVSITQPLALTTTATPSTINCFGMSTGSATVSVSGGTSGYTYLWTPSGGTNSIASGLSAGNYTVTITDSHSCTATNTVSITQPNTALATALTSTNVTCNAGQDGAASVNASGGTGPYTYSWSPAGGTNATASGLNAGNYTVTVTDNKGCTKVASVNINDGNSPPVPNATTSIYCEGQTINPLNAAGSGGTINWYSDQGATNQIGTGNPFTPNPTPTVTTVYYVTETNGNGCKSQVAADTVKINLTPTSPTIANATYCLGQIINPLTSNSTGGTVTWYSDAGLLNQVGTGNSYLPSPTPSTTTVYYVVSTSPANCKSSVGSDTVKIYPNPVISGGTADTAKCGSSIGGVTGIIVSNGTPAYTYQWTNVNTGVIAGNHDSLKNVGAGTYSLLVTDANGCMASSANNFTVVATTAAEAAFTPSAVYGQTPLAVTFTNTSTGAINYVWNFGETGALSTQQNTGYTYNSTGTFTVTLVATNGGCSDTTFVVIHVDENTLIIIPNIFSPNGDGINDGFFITTKGIRNLKCIIFNRWGQEVYSLDAPDQVWDGILNNGNHASEGTYYYIIEASGFDGKNYKEHGPLTLVK
ncbi:MAG TPA: gliding motility-associated C-terminal domain-containing protein [Bacteroidia bacterium]|jgi:gliding motility-associated-like protein|nr:gliding motility-associated C-terminal domain-containing protein [Bacteroidia bacterium]